MKLNRFAAFFIILSLYGNAQTRVDKNRMQNDMKFWAEQMSEHAEFAADFTSDPTLKKRGAELAQQFKTLSTSANQKAFLKLADEILQYQQAVRADLKKSSENKNLEKALLDHMDKETKYAKNKAEGKALNKDEEVKFWSEEHEGEAHVIASLMSPKAPQLKHDAQLLEAKLKSNAKKEESLEVVQAANQELNTIGKELEKDPSKTRVPAKLAEHEKREREYAAKIFRQLKVSK